MYRSAPFAPERIVFEVLKVVAQEGLPRGGDGDRSDIEHQRGEGDEVRVVVQDSGIGFDPVSAERIFDAFHTTKPGGLGMGLSISRSIVESHGGRLWAVSNDGPGATLQFTLLGCQ
jgi:signal transduction histidine kinase